MKFEAGFLADNTYGVRHINRLVRSLVTKGIVDYPFPEDESEIGSFNINGFVQFLSEDGVIPETHKSMLVEKTDTGYILNPGMAFLDNGIYIFLETAQEFSCEPLMKVYWMHDTLTDKVEFMCTAEYPTSGSYLPLAEILEDGTVSNVRKCARAKLPGMASDYNRTKKIVIDESFTFDQKQGHYSNGYYTLAKIDLGGKDFKYLLFVCKSYTSWAIVDLESGETRYTYLTSSSTNTQTKVGAWNENQPGESTGSTGTPDFNMSIANSYSGGNWNGIYVDIVSISEDGLLTLKLVDGGTKQVTTTKLNFELYAF